MLGQFTNKLTSSFVLWLDHQILSRGQAYTNASGNFYPQQPQFNNFFTYGAPFAQFVFDSSISGANIITGVYLNNVFITTGVSGLNNVNYDRGQVYFNNNVNQYNLSGYFAIKDFNIKITNDSEETILFKTKYQLRPKFPQQPTGICKDCVTYPIIYVRQDGGENNPFALGGTDKETFYIKCVILADSLFNLHAIETILRRSVNTPVPLFEPNEMPFGPAGGLKSGVFNYSGIAYNKINSHQYVFIDKVNVPRISQTFTVDQKLLNPDVFFNFIDFEVTNFGDFRCN